MARIERATSPLPRECSTTELHGRLVSFAVPRKNENSGATQLFEITGAGEGNRTLVVSLEGFCSTIELHPRALYAPQLPLSSAQLSFLIPSNRCRNQVTEALS